MIDKLKQYFFQLSLAYFFVLLCFAVLDAAWLGWLAVDTYQSEMQGMLREQFITWPWVVFYLMYGFVTLLLTVVSNRDKPWFYASIDGALLGLASYGAYNLTNYSILEGFTLQIMLTDWIWGIFLTACSATAGYFGFALLKR